jgi:putative hydrolase of the HAD superfamily
MRIGQTLFVDADDTLWENNIHFERVIQAFCQMAERRGRCGEKARQTLYAIERVRTRVNGYGVKNFHASLCAACSEVLGPDDHAVELAELAELCAALTRESLTLLPAVRETLRELSGRHRLILLTKGDLDDQWGKLQRSGLRPYFHQIDVVREKDVDAYYDALVRHGVRPQRAWMVGNSPRSDVLPALEAGLGAVFIPHPVTWELEQGELPANPAARLLRLARFDELIDYF